MLKWIRRIPFQWNTFQTNFLVFYMMFRKLNKCRANKWHFTLKQYDKYSLTSEICVHKASWTFLALMFIILCVIEDCMHADTRFSDFSTNTKPIIWVIFSVNETSNERFSLLKLGKEASLSSPAAPGPLIATMHVSFQCTVIRLVNVLI